MRDHPDKRLRWWGGSRNGGWGLLARVKVRHFIIHVRQHCNLAVALCPLVRCWCQLALERTCDRCPCLPSSHRLHHPPPSRLQFISRRAPSPKTSLNHPAHVKWCRACLSLTSKCPSEICVSSRAVVLSVNAEFWKTRRRKNTLHYPFSARVKEVLGSSSSLFIYNDVELLSVYIGSIILWVNEMGKISGLQARLSKFLWVNYLQMKCAKPPLLLILIIT